MDRNVSDRTVFLFGGIPLEQQDAASGPITREPAYRAAFASGERLASWPLGFPGSGTSGRAPAGTGGDVTGECRGDALVSRDMAATLHGCAAFEAVLARGRVLPGDALAEHSLGLYAALYAARALSLEGALAIARAAARAIEAEAEEAPGGLLAVLGLGETDLERLGAEAGLELANRNSATQAVFGGPVAAIERGAALAEERGALLVRRVPVPLALHTAGAERAAARLAAFVESEVLVRAPERPLLAHTGSAPGLAGARARVRGPAWLESAEDVRTVLARNLAAPVLWHDVVLTLRRAGYRRFVDLGPGDALARTIRFIDRDAETVALDAARGARAGALFLEIGP